MDSHYFAFTGLAALLVLSPGATMIVVADAAIEAGRRAALWTVAGIGTANGTMALGAAFGVAAVVQRVPAVLRVISIVGAAYLAWLGLRALWRAARGERPPEPPDHGQAVGPDTSDPHERDADASRARVRTARRPSRIARFGRGLLTNYANPSVVIFYAVVVPQFITTRDVFLPRYLLLGGTHVAMSVVWQGAVGVSVGTFAERMARPGVRRALDVAMGVALLGFAIRIALG